MVMCFGQGADMHMVQLMSLRLTIFCSSKSRLVLLPWLYLSGAGSPGSPGKIQEGRKMVVCVCFLWKTALYTAIHPTVKIIQISNYILLPFSALTLLVVFAPINRDRFYLSSTGLPR